MIGCRTCAPSDIACPKHCPGWIKKLMDSKKTLKRPKRKAPIRMSTLAIKTELDQYRDIHAALHRIEERGTNSVLDHVFHRLSPLEAYVFGVHKNGTVHYSNCQCGQPVSYPKRGKSPKKSTFPRKNATKSRR